MFYWFYSGSSLRFLIFILIFQLTFLPLAYSGAKSPPTHAPEQKLYSQTIELREFQFPEIPGLRDTLAQNLLEENIDPVAQQLQEIMTEGDRLLEQKKRELEEDEEAEKVETQKENKKAKAKLVAEYILGASFLVIIILMARNIVLDQQAHIPDLNNTSVEKAFQASIDLRWGEWVTVSLLPFFYLGLKVRLDNLFEDVNKIRITQRAIEKTQKELTRVEGVYRLALEDLKNHQKRVIWFVRGLQMWPFLSPAAGYPEIDWDPVARNLEKLNLLKNDQDEFIKVDSEGRPTKREGTFALVNPRVPYIPVTGRDDINPDLFHTDVVTRLGKDVVSKMPFYQDRTHRSNDHFNLYLWSKDFWTRFITQSKKMNSLWKKRLLTYLHRNLRDLAGTAFHPLIRPNPCNSMIRDPVQLNALLDITGFVCRERGLVCSIFIIGKDLKVEDLPPEFLDLFSGVRTTYKEDLDMDNFAKDVILRIFALQPKAVLAALGTPFVRRLPLTLADPRTPIRPYTDEFYDRCEEEYAKSEGDGGGGGSSSGAVAARPHVSPVEGRGQDAAPAAPPRERLAPNCTNCGAELTPSDRFCHDCGVRVP